MNLPRRYLLKIAVNLYYVSFDSYPNYGNEIDLIDMELSSGDDKLDNFCDAFFDWLYNNANFDFYKIIEDISSLNSKRSCFFKLCCDKEIELKKNKQDLLVFYWDDYFLFEKDGFEAVVEKATKKKESLLLRKKQLTIDQVVTTINGIITNSKIVFKNLHKIVLFGSLAKGTNTENSDVDLLLVFDENEILLKELVYMFCEEFAKMVDVRPDVSIMKIGDSNRFINWILSYGVEVYVNEK